MNEQVCERESTVGKLSSELHQLETSCQYLATLLHDHECDRAKTNIAFTDFLVDYRKEIMPQILKSWGDLDFEHQDACCRVNNFFRGLHLLVIFAESFSSEF